MMIGLVQPGTSRGTFLQMMGSRKTTPPRILRMVPFGDFHISFSSISRNGLISLSLMYCQMIRVISSPSSSTTGLVTLIFAMELGPFLEQRGTDGVMYPRYSIANALAKASALRFRPKVRKCRQADYIA